MLMVYSSLLSRTGQSAASVSASILSQTLAYSCNIRVTTYSYNIWLQ